MSNLRSISEGSFVLGDTNGLTFEAGSGIKISEPSEGTVRIANDETVLWSGEVTAIGNEITLSETPVNFEIIKIFFYDVNGAQSNVMECSNGAEHNSWSRITCNQVMGHSDGTEYHRTCVLQRVNSDNPLVWKAVASFSYTIKSSGLGQIDVRTTTGQTTYVKPWKILGVNRIGANVTLGGNA